MLTSTTGKTLVFWVLLGALTTTLILRLDYASLNHHREGLVRTLEQNLRTGLSHEAALLQHAAQLAQMYDAVPQHRQEHLQALLQLSTAGQHLHLLQTVNEEDISAFEQQMRQHQPAFLLQGLSAMTPAPLSPESGEPVYHPITQTLSKPHTSTPWQPGTDPSLSPVHQQAVLAADQSASIHYSQIYQLQRGDPAVSLYSARPDQKGTLALAVSLKTLLDTQDLPIGSQLSLISGDTELGLLKADRDASPLFYLSDRYSVEIAGQDWQLSYAYPVFWYQLSWGPQVLALILNTLGSLLFMAWLRQREETSSCRLEGLKVRQLQQHLQQRTQALQEQLDENQLLTHRILDIQERERRHLAQELHDELGQCLTAIRTDASMLLRDQPDPDSEVHQHAANIDSIAGHIYDVTYDLMHALRPTLLDDLGLVDALRELINNGHLERQGVSIELELKGALNEMGERYNISLYRLIQEALTNIQRHASCQHVKLRLERLDIDTLDDHIELDIQDDGQGFDPDAQQHNRRFGLLGMQARVRALHGDFKLSSRPGEGTQISIRMPLVAAEVRGVAKPSAAGSVAPLPSDADHQTA